MSGGAQRGLRASPVQGSMFKVEGWGEENIELGTLNFEQRECLHNILQDPNSTNEHLDKTQR